jgi:hypothetical protein
MGFRNTEHEYSQYTTSQIYWQLENHADVLSANERFVLCDQLLQRKQAIKHISQRFEDIVHSLKRDVIQYVEKYDDRFSKAAVHLVVRKLKSAGSSVSSWFVMKEGEQHGPLDRFQIEKELERGGIDHVWKQGWPEWKSPDMLANLTDVLFYDQIFPREEQRQAAQPSQNQSSRFETNQDGSAMSIVTGVLGLVGAPLWLLACFALPYAGHGTFTGWFLPLIAAIFMLIASIPMGIGMMMRKLWAWNLTIFSSIVLLLWFTVLVVNNDVSSFWYVMSFFQGLLLILALSARSAFNRNSYEKSTA